MTLTSLEYGCFGSSMVSGYDRADPWKTLSWSWASTDFKMLLQRKIYGGDLGSDLLVFSNEEMAAKSATSSI